MICARQVFVLFPRCCVLGVVSSALIYIIYIHRHTEVNRLYSRKSIKKRVVHFVNFKGVACIVYHEHSSSMPYGCLQLSYRQQMTSRVHIMKQIWLSTEDTSRCKSVVQHFACDQAGCTMARPPKMTPSAHCQQKRLAVSCPSLSVSCWSLWADSAAAEKCHVAQKSHVV